MKKLLIAKLVLFSAILAALQLLLGAVAGHKDTPSPVLLCNKYLDEGCDIIYLCESTLYCVAPYDTDKAHIDQMLQRLLPEQRITPIAHDAFHLQLYADFCTYIAGKPTRPKLLIVPINLGTMSNYWDKRPEYQFMRFRHFLRHDSALFRALYRPLAVFHALDLTPVSQHDFEHVPVYDGDTPVGLMKEFIGEEYLQFSEENMRKQIILRYMSKVTPQHHKLQAMLRIVETDAASDMDVLFYLTPVDYETGNAYLGDRFKEHIAENATVVKSLLEAQGVQPLDLSLDLGADQFCWRSVYPNEHLNEKGRLYVAERLAEALRQRLDVPSS